MKKGEIFRKFIANPERMTRFEKLYQRYLFLLAIAHKEDPDSFRGLDGLTWPNGHAPMISRRKRTIECGQASAEVDKIYESDFYAEIGHSQPDFLRLLELILSRLGYETGLRNQIKQLLPKPEISASSLLL